MIKVGRTIHCESNKLQEQLSCLSRLGFSFNVVFQMVKIEPTILNQSADLIQKKFVFFVVLHVTHCRLLHHFHTISLIILRVGSNQDTKFMHGLRQTICLSKSVLAVAFLDHQRENLYKTMLISTLKAASISVFANLSK